MVEDLGLVQHVKQGLWVPRQLMVFLPVCEHPGLHRNIVCPVSESSLRRMVVLFLASASEKAGLGGVFEPGGGWGLNLDEKLVLPRVGGIWQLPDGLHHNLDL